MNLTTIKRLLEARAADANTDLDKKTREASDGAVGPSRDKKKKIIDPAKDDKSKKEDDDKSGKDEDNKSKDPTDKEADKKVDPAKSIDKSKKDDDTATHGGKLADADADRNDDGSLKSDPPPGGKTLTGEPANKIDIDPSTIKEAKSSCAVVAFGRMNPPTVGHERLVDTVVNIARKKHATPLVFLSRSEDKKKNPIPYLKKLQFARRAFGSVIQPTPKDASSMFGILKHLESQYHDVILVVGSDRVDEMTGKVKKYNGSEFHFDSIKVVSAGERDPDDSGVAGASASSLRKLAHAGDEQAFIMGLPEKLRGIGKQVFKATRLSEGLIEPFTMAASNLIESVELGLQRIPAEYELSESEFRSLYEKSEETGFPLETVVESYKRGVHSWTLTETILDHQQFAYNRVNAMLNGGSTLDDDLFEGFTGDIDVPIQVAQPERADKEQMHRTKVKPGREKKVQVVRKIIEMVSEDSVPGIKDGKGVRRIDMPQINDFDAMTKDLQANGTSLAKPHGYKPDDLKPLQKHFNQEKVDALKDSKDAKPILISSDKKIIDGHHRWMAAKQSGKEVQATQVGMKHADLLQFLKGKPYVGSKKLNEDVYSKATAHKLIASAHGKDSREYHYHMSHHHQLTGEWHRQEGRLSAAERSFARADFHHQTAHALSV